jgi:hypothetical protein
MVRLPRPSPPQQLIGQIQDQCELLPGVFGFAVQVVLALIVVCTLVYKKSLDKVPRTWQEFGLDSSKQVFGERSSPPTPLPCTTGSGIIHALNILFAFELNAFNKGDGDACGWYWLNIVIDCTLGVGVNYLLLTVGLMH